MFIVFSGDVFYLDVGIVWFNFNCVLDGVIDGWFFDILWFLDDLCLQGFFGCIFVYCCVCDFGVLDDFNCWYQGDILQVLVCVGGIGIGDLLLGGDVVVVVLVELDVLLDGVQVDQCVCDYFVCVVVVLEGEDVGLLFGGEQFKFIVIVMYNGYCQVVLVKFVQFIVGEVVECWVDLFVCEYFVLQCLCDVGVDVVVFELFQISMYVFFEVQCFDCMLDVFGCCGFVLLMLLIVVFVGDVMLDWVCVGDQLYVQGWLMVVIVMYMVWLYVFGCFIGNSDMYYGNFGFYLVDYGLLLLVLVYDMLLMLLVFL